MHVQVDQPPHVLEDEVGLRLVAPDENWRGRPDMHPMGTRLFRVSMVTRARFIEDLVEEELRHGVTQYVILGAGVDTFAQRKAHLGGKLRIFEVDQPGTQAWKKHRLIEAGYKIPTWLTFVPVDFEAGASWWEGLNRAGFDASKPAVIASAGVTMYLSKEAIAATLRQIAALAPGTTLAMTYILPMELSDPDERVGREMAEKGARASGTPFISFFTGDEITALALKNGFKSATYVTAQDQTQRYFANRTDGLKPSKSEELLIAKT